MNASFCTNDFPYYFAFGRRYIGYFLTQFPFLQPVVSRRCDEAAMLQEVIEGRISAVMHPTLHPMMHQIPTGDDALVRSTPVSLNPFVYIRPWQDRGDLWIFGETSKDAILAFLCVIAIHLAICLVTNWRARVNHIYCTLLTLIGSLHVPEQARHYIVTTYAALATVSYLAMTIFTNDSIEGLLTNRMPPEASMVGDLRAGRPVYVDLNAFGYVMQDAAFADVRGGFERCELSACIDKLVNGEGVVVPWGIAEYIQNRDCVESGGKHYVVQAATINLPAYIAMSKAAAATDLGRRILEQLDGGIASQDRRAVAFASDFFVCNDVLAPVDISSIWYAFTIMNAILCLFAILHIVLAKRFKPRAVSNSDNASVVLRQSTIHVPELQRLHTRRPRRFSFDA